MFAAGVCALALLALALPRLQPLTVAGGTALLFAFAVDCLRVRDPRGLKVERSLPRKAGLGQPFARTLLVRPGSAGGAWLSVFEQFPGSFDVVSGESTSRKGSVPVDPAPSSWIDPSGGDERKLLPETGAVVLERSYRGLRRGVHHLGDVRLRLRGPLGLVQRQRRLRGHQEIAIHSSLEGLPRTLKLAASERWMDLGVRRLRRHGGLTEFEALREYVRGDDVRWIDWKATARRAKPIVRAFQEERGQELFVLFDCGKGMAVRSGRGEKRLWSKLDFALDAGLQLAAIALQKGDRVGCLAFDTEVRAFVPPRRGRRQLARITEAVFELQPHEHPANLARALRELGVRHRRRALLAILSEVADPLAIPHQRQALGQSSRNHKVVFAALDDPSLREAALEAEADAAVQAAAQHLRDQRRSVLARLRGPGILVLDALPAEAAGSLLAGWLEARREML